MANRMLQWMVPRKRMADWFCWNALARVAVPVTGAAFALIIGLEAAGGGEQALESMRGKGLGLTLLLLLFTFVLAALLLFALQGSDLLECTLDGKGAHLKIYLPAPTPWRLILRGLPPGSASKIPGEPTLVSSLNVSWRDIRRVQLWPEKGVILLYSPRHWLRVWLPCTQDTWDAALREISERLGRKKNVALPAFMKVETSKPARTRRAAPVTASADLMEDIRRMNAEAEKLDASSAPDQP